MAGFTISGGFHFDPTGEGVAPAGITARGIGGMRFAPPPPPPPSFDAYTYKAIEQVWSNTGSKNGPDDTTFTANDAQENDVMILSVSGYTTTSYAPVPSGWTEITDSKIAGSNVPGYGVSHIAYYKICDDSGSHEFVVGGIAGETLVYTALVLRNLRVTGGPITSPVGDVTTRSSTSEAFAATDLDVFDTTSNVDDGTSWVLYVSHYEFGHRTMYGRGLSNTTLLQNSGGLGGSKIYREIVKGQSADAGALSRYIPSPTVYSGGVPYTPRHIGISIEFLARPTHAGGPWPSSLEVPE